MKKSTVIEALNEFPQKFDLDELLERLIVIEKIDAGLEEANSGEIISHDKVKKMVSKWNQ
jgi:predicted transcriptional regulator